MWAFPGLRDRIKKSNTKITKTTNEVPKDVMNDDMAVILYILHTNPKEEWSTSFELQMSWKPNKYIVLPQRVKIPPPWFPELCK